MNSNSPGSLGNDQFQALRAWRNLVVRSDIEAFEHLTTTRISMAELQLAPDTALAGQTLRDADTLCRLQSGRFAILLEDTPENGAIWTVERIRRRLGEQLDDVTVWAGIACYPANGFDGPEVLDRAREALSQAREWRQDRTEVADT